MSFAVGVQERVPEELIFAFESVVPPKLSSTTKLGLVRPDVCTESVNDVPTERDAPGDSD